MEREEVSRNNNERILAVTCQLNLGDGYMGAYGNILSIIMHLKIHNI